MFTKEQQADLGRFRKEWRSRGYEPSAQPDAEREVRLEFPMGEIAKTENVALALLVRRLGAEPVSIEASDKFNAQGLEGKLSLRVSYETALLFAQRLEPYRFQIRELPRARAAKA